MTYATHTHKRRPKRLRVPRCASWRCPLKSQQHGNPHVGRQTVQYPGKLCDTMSFDAETTRMSRVSEGQPWNATPQLRMCLEAAGYPQTYSPEGADAAVSTVSVCTDRLRWSRWSCLFTLLLVRGVDALVGAEWPLQTPQSAPPYAVASNATTRHRTWHSKLVGKWRDRRDGMRSIADQNCPVGLPRRRRRVVRLPLAAVTPPKTNSTSGQWVAKAPSVQTRRELISLAY